jgi:DNA-directed RNA polymerase II subunit RPB7
MRFEPDSTPPCFISEDQSIKIQKDDDIRLKVVGTNFENQNVYGIGTIKGDYLGLFFFFHSTSFRSILSK